MSNEKHSSKKMLKERIEELRKSLEATKQISIEDLATQINTIGFDCLRCGDCCAGEDNSVVAFPSEIRKILATTGIGWLDAVEPPEIGEWDSKGNFHTLEWRIKKDRESCKFYAKTGCKIYHERPILCKTYPFYLDEGMLRYSECRGLGRKIGSGEAERIAALVIDRSITEIREAIELLEKYTDFERGGPTKCGICIVHDSEGEQHIAWENPKATVRL